MRLYDSIGPNPKVVRMAIAEKAGAIETISIDLLGGENRQPFFVAMVPNGGTPAIQLDDGTVISEITAIAEYLEEVLDGPTILGATPEQRAETRMWTRKIDLYIAEPLTTGFRATEGRALFLPRMMLVTEAAGADLKAMAQDRLLWLDGLMQGRTWICGDRYTLADMLLYAFLEFGATVGQTIPAAATWLPGWYARAAARPSAGA